ncbi:MAG: FdtA/QdtA family cupin domain-containing protein [Gemmatimonadota bacterium]
MIGLTHHDDARGSTTILERLGEFPFDVRRALVITNVPSGAVRGEHANMRTSELIICAAGAVTLRVEDGRSSRSIPLSSQAGAILVPPTLWMELRDFAPGTVVLILADTDYRESMHASIRERSRWLRTRELSHVA